MDRRSFLASTGATALLVAGPFPKLAIAATQGALTVSKRSIDVNGRAASVFGLTDASGRPGLRLNAGQDFDVLLRNTTAEKTIVHWHGLTPPWESDGVADAPLPLIEAGADRAFKFPVRRPGTYWMHAHTLQEQALLAAPLIVADPNDSVRDEQDIVVLLHDFSFTPAGEIFENLRKGTSPGGMMDMSGGGMSGMDMSAGSMATDLNDITYDAFLANDRTLDDPEVVASSTAPRRRLSPSRPGPWMQA
jgi:FtsP/CotA-like multicopper oxidase with cupredoxin domain